MQNGRPRPPRIFISAAEQSADDHAAGLIEAFRTRHPDAVFIGLAGPRMRAAGCLPLADLTSRAAMLTGVLGRIPAALATISRIDRLLARGEFDAAVLIDSGTLHLPLARRCGARAIPVLYFVAPQTWASREWRLRALRERVQRLAVILPFEETYFRAHGIDAHYVGHPLFDRLARHPADPARIAELKSAGEPIIVLAPGSRSQVVREVLPGQLEIAQTIARRFVHSRFHVVTANPQTEALVAEIRAAHPAAPDLKLHARDHASVFAAASLALVASGTVTLEAAYHHTPMIVMYNARFARWGYPLLRGWMIKTKFLALPNILAGRRIVPEYMPWYRNPTEIAVTALELLSTPDRLDRMRQELAELMNPIVRPGACDAAAEQLDALLDAYPPHRRFGPPGTIGSHHRVW